MRAVVQTGYGSVDVLEVREVARPAVGEDEVRVRVRAASLHPDVWHVVTGRPWLLRLMGAGFRTPRNPIPGTDMAGIVDAVGRHVTSFEPGDAVFGETRAGTLWTNGGSFAEYVTARSEWLSPKPGNVSFEAAASVPSSGFIALQNLRPETRLQEGTRVLVNGAGGGVGSLALQIARAHGAHVTAVDGPGKQDLLRELGADEIVDYTREDFTAGAARWDLIFDVPGNHPFARCARVLAPGGRYVLVGHEAYGSAGHPLWGIIPGFLWLVLRSRFDDRLRGPGAPLPDRRETLAALRGHLERRELTPAIDSVWPLEQVREAFRHMTEGELRGKVILAP